MEGGGQGLCRGERCGKGEGDVNKGEIKAWGTGAVQGD